METFPSVLFQCLRQMDAEATTKRKDDATGLNWYGAHFKSHQIRPQTEVCWSQRLAQLLPQRGFPTQAEVRYPSLGRCKCDNVVTMEDGTKLWLENKGAWKDYWLRRGGEWIYRSYLLHPLVAGLDNSKTHTVPLDLQKLCSLTSLHADYAAVLLVGFDSDTHPMKADIADLVRVARLDQQPWSSANDWWKDPYRPNCFVRTWLWWRSVPKEPDGEPAPTAVVCPAADRGA